MNEVQKDFKACISRTTDGMTLKSLSPTKNAKVFKATFVSKDDKEVSMWVRAGKDEENLRAKIGQVVDLLSEYFPYKGQDGTPVMAQWAMPGLDPAKGFRSAPLKPGTCHLFLDVPDAGKGKFYGPFETNGKKGFYFSGSLSEKAADGSWVDYKVTVFAKEAPTDYAGGPTSMVVDLPNFKDGQITCNALGPVKVHPHQDAKEEETTAPGL